MSDQTPVRRDVACNDCGVPFVLYYDGTSTTTVRVICKCGRENQWNFTPQPSNRRGWGFGVKAIAP